MITQKNPTIINSGQTLITLIIFMGMSVTIVSAAVAVLFINTSATSTIGSGIEAYYIAEGGAENAILRLLRNPNYLGETLQVGQGTATITVTGADPKTIVSLGKIGNFSRQIQVVAGYTDNILTVSSWKEIY